MTNCFFIIVTRVCETDVDGALVVIGTKAAPSPFHTDRKRVMMSSDEFCFYPKPMDICVFCGGRIYILMAVTHRCIKSK